MSKEAVFNMKLKAELHRAFMAEAAMEGRPASDVMRELMRGHIEARRMARGQDTYLKSKVEAGRASMLEGQGRSNPEVEAVFAAKRRQVAAS